MEKFKSDFGDNFIDELLNCNNREPTQDDGFQKFLDDLFKISESVNQTPIENVQDPFIPSEQETKDWKQVSMCDVQNYNIDAPCVNTVTTLLNQQSTFYRTESQESLSSPLNSVTGSPLTNINPSETLPPCQCLNCLCEIVFSGQKPEQISDIPINVSDVPTNTPGTLVQKPVPHASITKNVLQSRKMFKIAKESGFNGCSIKHHIYSELRLHVEGKNPDSLIHPLYSNGQIVGFVFINDNGYESSMADMYTLYTYGLKITQEKFSCNELLIENIMLFSKRLHETLARYFLPVENTKGSYKCIDDVFITKHETWDQAKDRLISVTRNISRKKRKL